jgi:ABC-type branched-subunit amino acid transport system ATPase component/ABC-type branched-subunit amino acid transport system permease subunit
MAQGLALSLIFLSFVVVTGMGGMVSLAQATFVTAAALTTGLLFDHFGIPFYLAALLAIFVTVAVGMIVALPAIRLGGLPLALATLALAIVGDNVLFQWNWLTNTSAGWTIPRLVIGPFDLTSNRTMAMFLLLLVGVVMLLIRNLRVSSWGRSIAAVRSSEVAASTSGVSPVRVKLVLFAISAAIAGLGGILYTSLQTTASNSTTPYIDGLLWLATVVLFGIRRPAAAALAGIASAATTVIVQSGFHWWSWVPTWLSWNGTKSAEIPLILFGLGAVTLARSPDGFLAQAARQRYQLRARRAARARPDVPSVPVVALDEEAAVVAETQRDEAALVAAGAVRRPSGGGARSEGLLTVQGLHVSYGDVEVLHGIDLAVPAGQITALLGANGGGKSTFCAAMAGLVTPSDGSVLLDGNDIVSLPAHRRAEQGMLVTPESRGIFPGLSVEENLMLRLSSSRREQVYERFPLLGERRRLAAGDLSGGEQQMLALAPVLVQPPRLVIADEPTLGLAPRVVEQLLQVFKELRDVGSAILLVEEKVRDVLTVADKVAFIKLGHILWSGARADLDDEALVGAYLGSEA